MTNPLISRYYYAIIIDGEMRKKIVKAKNFKDTTDHIADPRIRTFLQAIIDKMLPELLKEAKK
jgi:hypothetical protein